MKSYLISLRKYYVLMSIYCKIRPRTEKRVDLEKKIEDGGSVSLHMRKLKLYRIEKNN